MGIIGDAEGFFNAFVDNVTGSSPRQDAAAPTVHGGPPGPVEPARWTAPDASGSGGHITVQRDVLDQVARSMHQDVAEIDNALGKVQAASGGLSGLAKWSTGTGFSVNATNACDGFASVGTHTADTQTSAAKTLTDSASAYDEAETTSHQAINGVSSALDDAIGSVTSALGMLL